MFIFRAKLNYAISKMASIQNLNKLEVDYEEFVNSVVKDVSEKNLFWSDDDKKLCYSHWLRVSVIYDVQ